MHQSNVLYLSEDTLNSKFVGFFESVTGDIVEFGTIKSKQIQNSHRIIAYDNKSYI